MGACISSDVLHVFHLSVGWLGGQQVVVLVVVEVSEVVEVVEVVKVVEVVEVVEVVADMVGRVVRVGSQPWRASGCGSSELQSGG